MQPSSLLLAFVALGVVLGLIWLAQRLARSGLGPRLSARFGGLPGGGRSGGGRLGAVQTLALDSRRRLHLVRCEGRQVLLLTGGAQDLVVGWLPTEAERAP